MSNFRTSVTRQMGLYGQTLLRNLLNFRGTEALKLFIRKYLNYPDKLKESGIEGTVIVSFVIDTDGSIKDIRLIRGIHPLLDTEAIRVAGLFPPWKPARQRGKPVRLTYTLPIRFNLVQEN